MKKALGILVLCFVLFSIIPGKAQEKKILVFHKTEGFWHESIPAGKQVLEELGEENGFATYATDNADIFLKEDLKNYNLVVFLNTTGNVLKPEQQEAFENYINTGGNFFGIHSAADTEYDWEWYGKLVGAYFNGHPHPQWAEIQVEKPQHPTVAHLPQIWKRKDEWYNYKTINPKVQVLLWLDESTYEGGENGEEHPIAWYQNLKGGGRAIYTGGGHTIESYSEPLFIEHLLQCIFFAMGVENVD